MSRKINLETTTVIDAHCFVYDNSPLTEEFINKYFSLGGVVVGSTQNASKKLAQYYAKNTVAYRVFLKEISTFFSCGRSLEDVIKARNSRATVFDAHVKALMEDANIETLVVDNGAKEICEVDKFAKLFPGKIEKTFRLETLIQGLLESSENFESLLLSFDEALKSAVEIDKCVAFKSVIAYRSGLDVTNVDAVEAKQDFDNREDRIEWFGPYVKRVRDFLLRRALILSIDLKVPVLIHTGLGDTDIQASKCNPAFLAELLKDEAISPARVLLIHGGYPYTIEAGWLANVLPNVYLELSSSLPPFLEPAVSANRYGELLRWVPIPKLIYGSDGSEFPEILWYYAKMAKRSMGKALAELVEEDIFSVNEALEQGENIFSNNARTLFGIQDSGENIL